MNISRLVAETSPHVIDPTLGFEQGQLEANYFRGMNLGYVASRLILSHGQFVPGGFASINRNAARGYASREAMCSAQPERFAAHQSPDLFLSTLKQAGYNGTGIFPAIVLGFNSEHAERPEPAYDRYGRGSMVHTHERIVPDIPVADLEPLSRAFIQEYFDLP